MPKITFIMIIVFPCFKEQPYNLRFAQTSYLVEKIVTEDKVTFEAVDYMYCNLSALHTLFVGIGEVR